MTPWNIKAIKLIEADFQRSSDTHLIKLDLLDTYDINFYLKDESTHPSGSLKHRLARSLFLYAICNGWINEKTAIVEASSGSTAISEAYFAKLLGLKFYAVVPKSVSTDKIEEIEFFGGKCVFVDNGSEIYAKAESLAQELKGHYMDQFKFAERATDWRGNNNIADSTYEQMKHEKYPIPKWIVCGAGTGGTSATLGRYIRYKSLETQLCVVDPENSVFYDYHQCRDKNLSSSLPSIIEGIGRPRVEESFIAELVDKMLQIPDAASIASIYFLKNYIGRKCGASTGTNFYGSLLLAKEMIAKKEKGSIVSLLCDSGERYQKSYYSKEWILNKGLDVNKYQLELKSFFLNKSLSY